MSWTRIAKRPDAEIIKDLARLEDEMSPENISHDGELPRSVVNRRYRELGAKKQALIQELGREPSNEEIMAAWKEMYR